MSSLLNSSINGSSSNLSDGSGRTYTSSFAGQSGAPSPVYHHAGSIQGLHNIHGNYNVPNLSGNLGSRNSGLNGVPSSPGVQQQNGSISNGRFASSNLPVPLSQMSHGSSHGHPDSHLQMSHGSSHGHPDSHLQMSHASSHGHPDSHLQMSHASSHGHPDSHLQMSHASSHGHSDSHLQMSHGHTGLTNRTGLGVSPMLGNAGSRMTSSMGNNNMVGGGTMGRTLSSGGGGLSNPSLGSRLNLAVNAGTGNIGQNRMMSGVLPQGSPQVLSMLGNSYPTAGGLSQNHVQTMNSLNSMGMLNDMNSNDTSPFDINSDFPQLTSRPGSDGGQGQLGSRLKQGLGISPIVQQNQEFSIQNEDFPALPGYKGSNADYPMDLHHKEQHENSLLMMQSQQLPMGRSGGFSLGGGYTSHHPQQQQQQQHAQAVSGSGVSIHGADIFSSSHPSYHSQAGGPTSIGLRSMNSANSVSNYDQLIQQYQQQQNSSQYRLQQMSSAVGAVGQPFRDVGTKPMQAATQSNPDRFGLLGLRSIIKMTDPALSALALGIDLTTLGLNLNSTENLYKTFGSPWSNEPAKADPEFSVPQCYYARSPPPLHPGLFAKLLIETLFYIFYSMPKDEAQLYAANELNNRAWFYHKEHRLWFIRVGEPLVKTSAYERGSYHCFDPNTFETVQKDNFVLFYEMLEKRPSLSHQHLM